MLIESLYQSLVLVSHGISAWLCIPRHCIVIADSEHCDHGLRWVARPAPDCEAIHRDLKRPGVTLQLLWLEYLKAHPQGYRYNQFCNVYRRWVKKLHPSLRQRHRAGEKVFIGYSGMRLHVPSTLRPGN